MSNFDHLSCKICSEYGACPFSYSNESDQVQNYGCLPSSLDIVTMRVKYGKTWACHANEKKPCLGALNYLKEKGFPHEIIDNELMTLDHDWHLYIK